MVFTGNVMFLVLPVNFPFRFKLKVMYVSHVRNISLNLIHFSAKHLPMLYCLEIKTSSCVFLENLGNLTKTLLGTKGISCSKSVLEFVTYVEKTSVSIIFQTFNFLSFFFFFVPNCK